MKKFLIASTSLFLLLTLTGTPSSFSADTNDDISQTSIGTEAWGPCAELGKHYTDLFKDCETWTTSNSGGNDSKFRLLQEIINSGGQIYQGDKFTNPQKYSVVDINADGFPDFLYHEVYGTVQQYTWYFDAVYLNNGNLNFDRVYKCAYYDPYNANFGQDTYRGDCATGSSPTPVPNKANEIGSLMWFVHQDIEIPINKSAQLFTDINGDGITDLMSGGRWLINQGNMEFQLVTFN